MNEHFKRAHELFMQYDGSRFYMSRDSKIEEFDASQIPEEIIEAWKNELITTRINDPALYATHKTAALLNHHRIPGYTAQLIKNIPSGDNKSIALYLTELMEYASKIDKPTGKLRQHLIGYMENALLLLKTKKEMSKNEVERLLALLEEFKRKSQA